MEMFVGGLVGVVVVAVAVWAVQAGGRLAKRETILEYERGVRFRRGTLAGMVGPGVVWYSPANTQILRVDLRPRMVTVSGQELLSADGVTIKISLAATYAVSNPEKALLETENYVEAAYLALQLALRDEVSRVDIDTLLEKRDTLGPRILEKAAPKVEWFGVHLIDTSVKDIMFPGALKQMMAQVVSARKEGQAALERARGESAALRNLANAAKMVQDNPWLMQLRLLQTVGENGGNTVVMGWPGGTPPFPIRGSETPPIGNDSGQ